MTELVKHKLTEQEWDDRRAETMLSVAAERGNYQFIPAYRNQLRGYLGSMQQCSRREWSRKQTYEAYAEMFCFRILAIQEG